MKTGSVFSGFGRILNTSKTAGRQWDTIRHDACPQVYWLVDAKTCSNSSRYSSLSCLAPWVIWLVNLTAATLTKYGWALRAGPLNKCPVYSVASSQSCSVRRFCHRSAKGVDPGAWYGQTDDPVWILWRIRSTRTAKSPSEISNRPTTGWLNTIPLGDL